MDNTPLGGYTRIDSLIKYLPKTEGIVTGVYLHSFDVRVMDFLLNFTTREELMHPLSVFLVVDIQRFIEKNQKISVAFPEFKFGETLITTQGRFFPPTEKLQEGASLRENVTKILQVLKNFGRCSEVSSAYLKKDETPFLKVVHYIGLSLKKYRRVPLDEYIQYFGAGVGLTPAWDDFCVGMLFADRVFRGNAVTVGKNFFNVVREKTTLTSFWQLRFAELGKLSLQYERFITKLSVNRVSSTEIVKCINVGHSSGTDILCGIHSYLANFVL